MTFSIRLRSPPLLRRMVRRSRAVAIAPALARRRLGEGGPLHGKLMAKPRHLALGVLTGVLDKKPETLLLGEFSFQIGDHSWITESGKSRTTFRVAMIQYILCLFNDSIFHHGTTALLDPPIQRFAGRVNSDEFQGKPFLLVALVP